ncbi:YbjN domain-containing protein [Phenylobacterium immobile]|uniref:YbjN domain-containing protein n=1 Tax=Phenylobacterium immobile TaxID=21 RepID=UPI000AF1E7A8|nr:YbjN domain-containing protein [Phenylobacterium immobile]
MRILPLLLCGVLAGAPAAAQTRPPAKPAAPQAAFDARDPASLTGLLAAMGAKGEISGSEADSVFMRVTTPAYGFSVQFAGCDASRKACKAVLFSAPATKGAASLIQLNRFNQTAIACRAFQDQTGQLRAAYDALLFARDSRDEMTAHLGAWQGCLAAFGEFLDDPNGYLASAP